MNYEDLRGSFRDVAFTTPVPFTDDAADVRYDALAENLADLYDAGADGLMVTHPVHTYAHEAGLREYYSRICDATDLGVAVYKRGPELTPEVLSAVCERDEVVAVKYAAAAAAEFSRCVEETDGEVAWVNGLAERFALAFAMEGAVGYTTGIGNFAPEATLALFEAVDAGGWGRAPDPACDPPVRGPETGGGRG